MKWYDLNMCFPLVKINFNHVFHQQERISSESLASLELCVSQLFSGSATKEQIQKIHDALDKFSRQKGAWKDALYFLGQTTNPQTAMYSLTVLEVILTF